MNNSFITKFNDTGEEEKGVNSWQTAFQSTRFVNVHSYNTTRKGNLDFRIHHRFSNVGTGAKEFFGLDYASIMYSFEYGLSNKFTLGVGRTNQHKLWDGFIKYKLLDKKKIKLTALTGTNLTGERWSDDSRKNYFTSRLNYYFQVHAGFPIKENLIIQLSPTLLHRNLIEDNRVENNDLFVLSPAIYWMFSPRFSIMAETHQVLNKPQNRPFYTSNSLSFNIKTGQHLFQIVASNSIDMHVKGYISETENNWSKGGFRIGFNILRQF